MICVDITSGHSGFTLQLASLQFERKDNCIVFVPETIQLFKITADEIDFERIQQELAVGAVCGQHNSYFWRCE